VDGQVAEGLLSGGGNLAVGIPQGIEEERRHGRSRGKAPQATQRRQAQGLVSAASQAGNGRQGRGVAPRAEDRDQGALALRRHTGERGGEGTRDLAARQVVLRYPERRGRPAGVCSAQVLQQQRHPVGTARDDGAAQSGRAHAGGNVKAQEPVEEGLGATLVASLAQPRAAREAGVQQGRTKCRRSLWQGRLEGGGRRLGRDPSQGDGRRGRGIRIAAAQMGLQERHGVRIAPHGDGVDDPDQRPARQRLQGRAKGLVHGGVGHGLQRIACGVAARFVGQESGQNRDHVGAAPYGQLPGGLQAVRDGGVPAGQRRQAGTGVGEDEDGRQGSEDEAPPGVGHAVEIGAVGRIGIEPLRIQADPGLADAVSDLPVVGAGRQRLREHDLDGSVVADVHGGQAREHLAAARRFPEGQRQPALVVRPARHDDTDAGEGTRDGELLSKPRVVVERHRLMGCRPGGQPPEGHEDDHGTYPAEMHGLLSRCDAPDACRTLTAHGTSPVCGQARRHSRHGSL